MARPAKLTKELTSKITRFIRDGNSPATSASLAGISPSTYFYWMKKGSNKEPGYLEFSESIERAIVQSIALRVGEITTAAKRGSWRASAWMLERLAPESFGKQRTDSSEFDPYRPEMTQGVTLQSLEELIETVRKSRSQHQSSPAGKLNQPKLREEKGVI